MGTISKEIVLEIVDEAIREMNELIATYRWAVTPEYGICWFLADQPWDIHYALRGNMYDFLRICEPERPEDKSTYWWYPEADWYEPRLKFLRTYREYVKDHLLELTY